MTSNSLRKDGEVFGIELILKKESEIIQSLFSCDNPIERLTSILKEKIKNNQLGELIGGLNEMAKSTEEDLKRIFLSSSEDISNYLNFIDNNQVFAEEMNNKVQNVMERINQNICEVVEEKNIEIKKKDKMNKINETIIVLDMCRSMFYLSNKIHIMIKKEKFYSSLKLIDVLEHIHLPKFENFDFVNKISELIPLLKSKIETRSFENLVKWHNIEMERNLGTTADIIYNNLEILQNTWKNFKKDNSEFSSYKLNSPVELSVRYTLLKSNNFLNENFVSNMDIMHNTILVYQMLNQLKKLSMLYHKEIINKYNKMVYPIIIILSESDNKFTNITELNDFLRKVASFFLIDNKINESTRYVIRSRESSNELWSSFQKKIAIVLESFLNTYKFETVDEIISFKDVLGNFIQIMKNGDYRISPLYVYLIKIFRDFYIPFLIKNFRSNFIESIQSDHFMPLVVSLKKDYDSILKVCWYSPEMFDSLGDIKHGPISFPFSEDYVNFCLCVKLNFEDLIEFIDCYYAFDISLINDLILKNFFEKILSFEDNVGVCKDLQDFIQKNFDVKEIISQFYTNLEYYLFALNEISDMINSSLKKHTGLGIYSDKNEKYVLKAINHFTELKNYSEKLIFDMVDSKISALLEFLNYDDWFPTIKNKEANYSIKDFCLFLENLFLSLFSVLPKNIKLLGFVRTYETIWKHFSKSLKNASSFNRISIMNFDLDIKFIENLMNRLKSSFLNVSFPIDEKLDKTFSELRQYVDLLKLDSFDEFIKNPQYRKEHFYQIEYNDGLKLIEKLSNSKL